MKTSSIISVILVLLMIAAIGSVVVILYSYRIPKPEVKLVTPIVQPGDAIFAEMKYNKKIESSSILSVQLITDSNVVIATYLLSWKLDKNSDKVVLGVALPKNILTIDPRPKWKAKLKFTSVHELLGIKTADESYSTDYFEVHLDKK